MGFDQEGFLHLADQVTQELAPKDLKELEKQLAGADKLFSQVMWRKFRHTFTIKGLPFFKFYTEMRRIRLGGPVPKGLKATYKRVANQIIMVKSPYDGRSLSPPAVNQIALTRPMVMRTIDAVQQGHIDDSLVWGRFNAIFVPMLVDIAQDKGIYIKPTKQTGHERWATFRKMSPKQERIEKLRDEDPESYALMQQLGQTMGQIDDNIVARIEETGFEVKQGFLAGRPVKIGVDPATGEEMVYARDGSVVTKGEFFNKVRVDSEAQAKLARVPHKTQVPPKDLRLLPDDTLKNLDGDVEWDAITDDKAKQGRLTRLYPTKTIRLMRNDPEKGTAVEEVKVVVAGRYKGIYLDDLINSEGRLIEGTAYGYDAKKGKKFRFPKIIDPSDREPYVSVAEIKTRRQFQGKRITVKTQKLFLKIDGTRQNKELRNAIKALACNKGTKRGCIPSVSYEAVGGSRAAGFYFDPKDFGVVMDSLNGMSLSTAALATVKSYYKDLAAAEFATKNLDAYEPEALASENDEGEKFQFIKGRHDKNGEWQTFNLREKQKESIAWMDANGNSGVCALETGVGKCVRGDTLILTNRGLTPIRDINPGVTEPDTTAPVEGWSVLVNGKALPIKNFYYGGHKPTIKVTTRRGYEVEGSRAHPLLVRTPEGQESWVETPELVGGDYLCIERKEAEFPAKDPILSVPLLDEFKQASKHPDVTFTNGQLQTFPVPDQMTPEMGRLLAYIVGEGWTNSRKGFYVSQCPEKNPVVRADIEDLLQRLMGWTAKPEKDIRIHSVFLREYLARMGVGMGLSKDKVIPSVILRSSKETVQHFLRALIDAEGSVQGEGRSHIEFSTASEQMGREVQILLLRFGIVCSRRPKMVKGYDHTYWRLTITGQDAIEYQQWIGFISTRKAMASEDVPKTRNCNLDVVPHMAPAVGGLFGEMLTALGMNVTKFRHQVRGGSASFDSTVNHIRRGRRNPTYTFLREMLSLAADVGCQECPEFRAIATVVNRRFFYDPIESLGESDAVVMDIEVDDPSHCFIGNGIVNHNTAASIGMMLKLVRDGLAEPDSTYTRPNGVDVTTNGRFLWVCPPALRGNLKKELKGMLSDPKVMTDRVDILSFANFSGASRTGKVPKDLRNVPFWKSRMPADGKQGTPYQSKKAWDPALYTAIFFDEAQALKNITSARTQAALKLYHPRKICLTASPMERSPMEAYVLAAITNNTPLFGKNRTAKDNRKKMKQFKDRFCEVVGGRITGIKQDPLVQRDLHTWVKRNVFYADKTDVKEYDLPKPVLTDTPVEMPKEVEALYRDVAGGFATIMGGAARKFREREKGDAYKDKQAEKVFSKALKPIIKLLTEMSNRPEKALKDVAFAIEHGYLPEYVETDGEPKELPPAFLRILAKWKKNYTSEDIEAIAATVGNPKLQAAEETLASKLESAAGSRALLFSDDRVMCMEAGQHMAKTLGGIHVVALNTSIHFFRGSTEMDRLVYPLDRALLERLVKDPEKRDAILAKTGGVTEIKLPFHKKAYKKHPSIPARQGAHESYLANDWQQFVLKEIVTPNTSIRSCALLGKTYMHGHNLQAFNTVIHLDRNSWNSESMKQRTARSWRQGQDEEVDVVTLDFTYRSDDGGVERSEDDVTLDQIRKAFQEMGESIFDSIIKDAQDIELGAEWEGVAKRDASLWRLDKKVAELMLSPMLGRI